MAIVYQKDKRLNILARESHPFRKMRASAPGKMSHVSAQRARRFYAAKAT